MEEGYYLDDGTKVDEDSIPIPALCNSCRKDQGVVCNLTRMDQMDEIRRGEMFCCFAYVPEDTNVDKESILKEMRDYLSREE